MGARRSPACTHFSFEATVSVYKKYAESRASGYLKQEGCLFYFLNGPPTFTSSDRHEQVVGVEEFYKFHVGEMIAFEIGDGTDETAFLDEG